MAPGVATILASSAAALLLDVALRHENRLVVEAEVVPAACPPSPQVSAIEKPFFILSNLAELEKPLGG